MRFFVPALFILGFFVSIAQPSSAASIYLDPSQKSIGKGESILLTVRLDTTIEECVNAIDGVIELDNGLQVVDVSTGNSIFNLWVEPPTIAADKRSVSFAGGIPNGYCGRVEGDPQLTNSLMEIAVQAPSFTIGDTGVVPERVVRFSETTNAYLNDGFGTVAALAKGNSVITVGSNFVSDSNEWLDRVAADDIAPKQFSITLTSDESVYKGKYFIVFNTTDKQTGIDHYEVIEEPLHDFNFFGWGAADAPWTRASSPYVLSDQSLNSVIRVKAVDKAGNEYVASMVPDESIRGFSPAKAATYFFAGLFSLILLTLGIIAWVHVRRRHEDDDDEALTDHHEALVDDADTEDAVDENKDTYESK